MIQMLLQPVSFSDLLSCLGYAAAYETFFRRMRTELTWKRRLFMLLADLTGYLILMRLLPRTEYLRVLLLHLILAAASTLQLRLECRLDWSYAVFLGTSFVQCTALRASAAMAVRKFAAAQFSQPDRFTAAAVCTAEVGGAHGPYPHGESV